MNRLLGTGAALAAVALTPANPIHAQGFSASAQLVVGLPTVNREILATVDRLSGTAIGLETGVRLWRLELKAKYLQGGLESGDGQMEFDLVRGGLLLQVRPVDFIEVGIGPQARSYVSDAGTERWLTWEGRLGVDTWLVRPTLRSTLALSYALGGGVNTGSDFSQGRSLEGWLHARIPRAPVSVGIGYRVEYGSLGGNAGSDTLEEFLIGVAVGRR